MLINESDKAGGYGIQDAVGGSFVKSIQGCYYNVTTVVFLKLGRWISFEPVLHRTRSNHSGWKILNKINHLCSFFKIIGLRCSHASNWKFVAV